MCMVDEADGRWAELGSQIVKARKEHTCYDCRRTIPKGEPYRFSEGVGDDGFWRFHTCLHCRVGQEWLTKVCRGFLFGGVLEDLEEHTGYGIGVYRLIIGIRRQWKRFDGKGLMKVPAMPQTKLVGAH